MLIPPTPANQAFTVIGIAASAGAAGEPKVSDAGANTRVRGDGDGDGLADPRIVIEDGVATARQDTAVDVVLCAPATAIFTVRLVC